MGDGVDGEIGMLPGEVCGFSLVWYVLLILVVLSKFC